MMSRKLGIGEGWMGRSIPPQFSNLMSLTYFQSAVFKFKSEGYSIGSKRIFATGQEIADYNIKLKDGRLSYAKQLLVAKTDEQIERNAVQILSEFRKDYKFRLENNTLINVMDKLIGYLQKKGVDVVILLPPYPEATYKIFILYPKMKSVLEAELNMRNLAKKYHLKIIGSFDPLVCGFNNSDFVDAVHPRKEAIERLFKRDS